MSRANPARQRSRVRRAVTCVAAVGSALALLICAGAPSIADTGDEKKVADQKVTDLQSQLDETSADLAKAYLALQATQAKLPAAQAALASAQATQSAAKVKSDAVAAQLAVAQANEQRAVQQQAATQAQVESTQQTLDSFAADVFQGGGSSTSQLSVAFGATSPDDFATRVVMADEVSSMTNNALADLQNARTEQASQSAYLTAVRTEITDLKAQADAALTQAKAATSTATAAKKALDKLTAQQATFAAQVESKKAGELQRLAEAEADSARLQALLVAQAKAAAAAEAARQLAASAVGQTYTPVTGGSGFLSYPANGPITSPFGLRFHPILHVWKLHSGTDFGIPCGTPVYAAADGTVISAGWGGGDGNRVVIDHGIVSGVDLASTYNHLSSFVVTGGHVSRGQLIAYSGTTGYSTGCHLHFETLENGQFVNPIKWI